MRNLIKVVLVILFALVLSTPGFAKESSLEKSKQRIDDLFIWLVNDKLQLSPEVESSFTKEYRRLADQKKRLNAEVGSLIKSLEKSNDRSREALLKKYEAAVRDLGGLPEEEIKSLRKVLGDKHFVEYLALKRQMAQKLQTLLSEGRKVTSPPSGEPQIIEGN